MNSLHNILIYLLGVYSLPLLLNFSLYSQLLPLTDGIPDEDTLIQNIISSKIWNDPFELNAIDEFPNRAIDYFDDKFYVGGFDGPITSAYEYDGELFVGGEFESYNTDTEIKYIAKWNGSDWVAVPNQLIRNVTSMVEYKSDLVVSSGHVWSLIGKKWGNEWQTLGITSGGRVFKLIVYNNQLLALGNFREINNKEMHCIARWNGTEWVEFGGNIEGTIHTAIIQGSDLVIGGNFLIHGKEWQSVARWDGENWHTIGDGLSGTVYDLTIYQGKLVAAGDIFIQSGNRHTFGIAYWENEIWNSTGIDKYTRVRTLLELDGKLIATADSNIEGHTANSRIVIWDGDILESIDDSFLGSGSINTTIEYNGILILGGIFLHTDIQNIARFENNKWKSMGEYQKNGLGLSGPGLSLINYDNEIIVGGNFLYAGEELVNNIAKYDNGSWSPVGDGFNSSVNILFEFNGDLIAGGSFTVSGDKNVHRVAAWNGQSWEQLGEGFELGTVTTLMNYDGTLIAGGTFTRSGGNDMYRIAQWDGKTWQQLGEGFDGTVHSLAVFNDQLIVGGAFTHSGNKPMNYLAIWDGFSWQPLVDNLGASVRALIVHHNNLIIGGDIWNYQNERIYFIARWDGDELHNMDSGVNGTVSTFYIFDDEIYAIGWFVRSNVGVFRGGKWQPLFGILEPVYSGHQFGNDLWIAGGFKHIGELTSQYIARWAPPPRQPQSIDVDFTVYQETNDITITWNYIARAKGYIVQVASDEYFNDIIYEHNVLQDTSVTLSITLEPYTTYFFRVMAYNENGDGKWSNIQTYTVGGSDDEVVSTPKEYKLFQNYPNPFNNRTTILFIVPERSLVSIIIYNQLGQKVMTIVDELLEPRYYTYDVDFPFSSGIYYYRMSAKSMIRADIQYTDTKQFILLK